MLVSLNLMLNAVIHHTTPVLYNRGGGGGMYSYRANNEISIIKNIIWRKQLKIYSHKAKNFKVFLLLCSPVYLSKHNIYALFGRLKQFLSCFYSSIFDVPFCYFVE